MSDKLVYRPKHTHQVIDQTRRQIRLILLYRDLDAHGNICCRTSVFDLDAAPKFKAISYEWGSATPPRYIMVDDHLLDISENLWHFLEMFRLQHGNKNWLWIDQISIDQSNRLERNHQVKMMGSIYSTAAGVIAWLGTCNSDQTELLENLLYHEGQLCESLKFLFEYNYWTRLWIIQELLLGKNVEFYVGTTLVDLSSLSDIFEVLEDIPGFTLDPDLNCHLIYLLRLDPADYPQSLAVVLSRTGTTGQCSEPRDLIFGLLGLVDNCHSIEIDYRVSTETLMKDVLETVIYSRIQMQTVDTLEGLATALTLLIRKLGLPEQWDVWLGGPTLTFLETYGLLRFINSPWADQFDKSKWSVHQLLMIYREARAKFPSDMSTWRVSNHLYGPDNCRLEDWVEGLNSLDPSLLHLQRFQTLDNSQGDLYRQSAALPWDFGSRPEDDD